MKTQIFFIVFYSILTVVVFKNVFLGQTISGGDYILFWPENIAFLRHFAFFTWDATVNLGSNSVGSLHAAPYNMLISWIGLLVGDQTLWWERLGWWIPFFILSFVSTSMLVRKIFSKNHFWYFSPLIFLFNTYVFMMIGGGQIGGIGLSYAVGPFVLLLFIGVIDSFKSKTKLQIASLLRLSILSGLLFAIQVMFDLRIAYVTMIAVGLYFVLSLIGFIKQETYKIILLFFYTFFLPLLITGLLHAFWIIPMVIFRVNTIEQLGPAFNSQDAVTFFSFATFENTLSLLHPNWPENIFGKIGFMKPEFLIMPLLAFVSLLFVQTKSVTKSERKYLLFFSLLGLLGAFLAKGANEPFGFIYLWLFDQIPGFIMFRDPTKWYLLVSLAYSVLIPFSIYSFYQWLNSKCKVQNAKLQFKVKKFIPSLFLLFTLCFLLFLIRPAFLGELGGTFKTTSIPEEYRTLKTYLLEQKKFSRTLWLPKRQRFVFLSSTHPAVDADIFFGVSSASGVLAQLKKPQTEQLVQDASINYIILPYDSEKELFVEDTKYIELLNKEFVKTIDEISWLHKYEEFGKIVVYEVISPKERFWTASQGTKISYQTKNSTHYIVSLVDAKKGETLVFSDNYDSNWEASQNGRVLRSQLYDKRYNSFVLQQDGSYQLTVSFAPQKVMPPGILISLVTLLVVIVILLRFKKI